MSKMAEYPNQVNFVGSSITPATAGFPNEEYIKLQIARAKLKEEIAKYLGCKLSIISKVEVRYEGILVGVDLHEDGSVMTLKEATVYGTEDRLAPNPLLPAVVNQSYEFIMFRGNELKSVEVIGETEPMEAMSSATNSTTVNDLAQLTSMHCFNQHNLLGSGNPEADGGCDFREDVTVHKESSQTLSSQGPEMYLAAASRQSGTAGFNYNHDTRHLYLSDNQDYICDGNSNEYLNNENAFSILNDAEAHLTETVLQAEYLHDSYDDSAQLFYFVDERRNAGKIVSTTNKLRSQALSQGSHGGASLQQQQMAKSVPLVNFDNHIIGDKSSSDLSSKYVEIANRKIPFQEGIERSSAAQALRNFNSGDFPNSRQHGACRGLDYNSATKCTEWGTIGPNPGKMNISRFSENGGGDSTGYQRSKSFASD